ncbi:MAG: hypothetical protein K6B70_08020 [Clostridia bacterium]|nr:hypothetical protein [Clostridia bacterium]
MKTRRKIYKIISILIVIMMIAVTFCNFSYAAETYESQGLSLVGVIKQNGGTFALEGIIGMLIFFYQEFALLLFAAIQGLTIVITGVSSDGFAGTIGHVVFNRCGLTSANFFPEVWVGDTPMYGAAMGEVVTSIRTYYNIIRNLSIAILLFILIYVGIRMAISTTASDEAKYKKMLKDWAVSLVLVFMLHFIMIITFLINNTLVYALSGLEHGSAWQWTILMVNAAIPGWGLGDLIIYGSFVIGTVAFVVMYVKRTIVLGFLIVISPLITITYAIDKMGDGKSQALNAWMKEFIFTVIIQPFHCIIYLVFYDAIMSSVSFSATFFDLGKVIFAAGSAWFMLKAEGIVKKIFGVQPSSIGEAIGTGAMALTMATSLFKGSGNKLNKSKGEMKSMDPDKKGGKAAPGLRTEGTPDAGAGNNGGNSGNAGAGDNGGNAGAGTGDNAGNAGNGGQRQGNNDISNAIDNATNSQRFEKLRKVGRTLKKPISNTWKRQGGLKTIASRGSAMAGFIAGAAVGDFKSAASVATAAGGVAKTAANEIEYKKAERILADNQRVYAGAYEDFAREYRRRNGADASDEAIRAEISRIIETNGLGLEEWQQDIYDKADQLGTGAEIMGYSDGADYVNDTGRLVAEGVITHKKNYVPKYYNRNNNNNGNDNVDNN